MDKDKIYYLTQILFIFISLPLFSQSDKEVNKLKVSSKLVLVGETHNIESNQTFQFHLIDNLVKTNNLKYVIIEHSYSGAFLYNKFLETGDTSLVCNDFYFNSSEEKRVFWNNLYKLNKTIDNKIYLLGLDYERSYPFVKTLNLILNDLKFEDDLLIKIRNESNRFLNTIIDPEETNLELFKKIKNSFNQYFKIHTQEYLKNIFGEYYIDMFLMYKNQHLVERNKNTNMKWFENLNRIIKEKQLLTKNNTFLGVFGAAHVASNKFSFANISYYNDNSIFKTDVRTIIMHYHNVYKKGVKFIENTGSESINNRMIKDLKIYFSEEEEFKLIDITKMNFKPRKYSKHVKYIFLVKNQSFQKQNKFTCRQR